MVKSVKVAGCLAKHRHNNVLDKCLRPSSQQKQQQHHHHLNQQIQGAEEIAADRIYPNQASTSFVIDNNSTNYNDNIDISNSKINSNQDESTFIESTTTSSASSIDDEDQRCQRHKYYQNNLINSTTKKTATTTTTNALPFESIPGPKPSLPFIGTNWIYFPIVGYYQSMKLHEANMDKYKRYGPIMKEEYQRGYPSVTVFDPKDIKEVFMREGTCPSRPVLPYVIRHRQSDPSRYPNVGLANMMGKEWLELRSQLAPLLLSKDLKRRHIGSQNRVSTRLVNYIKNLLPASSNFNNKFQNNNNINKQSNESEIESSNRFENFVGNYQSDEVNKNNSVVLSETKNDKDNNPIIGGNVYNIQEVFYRFSMESIMNLCINQELGCLNNNNYSNNNNNDNNNKNATSGDNKDNYNNSCSNSSSNYNNSSSSNNNNNNNDINLSTVTSDGELIFQAAMNFFEAQHKLYYGSNLWKYYNTKLYRQLCDSQNAIHHIASKYIDVALNDLKKRKQNRLVVDYTRNGNTNNKCNHTNNNNINIIDEDDADGEEDIDDYSNNDDVDQSSQSEEHESLLETLYSTNKFSDLEIKSTIVDFIGGGIYTVANTLTMALYLLASNPSVQEQLYQEICQVFKQEIETGSDINIDLKKLEQLKFLKLCLKESYRLLPTIPGIARILQKDLVLSNYLVPKNTLVFCNFMVTCRLPEYFEDPDTYNPSRWERTGKTKGDLAFCLLPFGHGVRKCIGHNFAELEIYVALAKLVRSFQIRTIDGDAKSLELSYKFIVVPERPVHLTFLPRARYSRFLM